MPDTSHFQIKATSEDDSSNEEDELDLNFRNMKDEEIIDLLRQPFCDGFKQMANVDKLRKILVYRKTVLNEINEIVKKGGFPGNKTETWITERFEKVLKFQNKGIPLEKRAQQRILELTLNKEQYSEFRVNDVIPQFKSKGSGKSVYNFEGIPGGACQSKASTVSSTVERNIGINKSHVDKFNKTIKSINVLDPEDPWVKNKYLRYLSRNKVQSCMIAITVIYEIKNITLILMDENGNCAERIFVSLTEFAINQIGSQITFAVASLIPGFGSFAIGVLGGLIFAYIGKKVGELIFSVQPKVAPGEGPPMSEYFSFVYGATSSFGDPLSEYTLGAIIGLPAADYPANVIEGAFQPPRNDYEDQFTRMSCRPPT